MISVQKEKGEVISVTVHLQSKNYVISNEELHSAKEYSTGDLDIRALEIAVNRFCTENGYKDITSGGNSGFGYSILLGDPEDVKKIGKMHNEDFYLKTEDINSLKVENRVGVLGGAYSEKYAIDVNTGEKVKLANAHEYAIIGSDRQYAYLSNPHDSSQKLKLEIDDVYKTFSKGMLFDIK